MPKTGSASDIDHLESQNSIPQRKRCSVKPDTILLVLMVLSALVGVALGAGLKSNDRIFTPREIMYIGFLGDLFLRMLKMLILPLIVSSLINSLANLNVKTAGRLGLVTII